MARCVGIAFASCGNKRVITVCKHIYDDLQSKGVKPNRKGLASMYDPLGIHLSEKDLMQFPSYTELTCRISRPSERNPHIQDHYWNREHFLNDAGLTQHCNI
jgi:hypothetical protein